MTRKKIREKLGIITLEEENMANESLSDEEAALYEKMLVYMSEEANKKINSQDQL